MSKIEVIKQEKDGLAVLPDILRHATDGTPLDAIPDDDLVRMKWYGVFQRQQTPGHFMMRLRTPGGQLSSNQAATIAEISAEFGRGTLDITTRQNVQLRWLTLASIPEIWRRLEAVGMTSLQSGMDNVRNYVACPLAGLDAGELIDTTPLLEEMGRVHLGNLEFSNLPRKFNVSLTGCKEDCGQAQTHDLAFVPARRNVSGRPTLGFNVLVGGALGGTSPRLATPLGVFVRPGDVVPLFVAVLRVFRDHGPREQRGKTRLKWLIGEKGEAWMRDAVAREMGEPLLGPGDDARIRIGGDHLGVHAQRAPGLQYVGLHVPVGRMTSDQLAELSHLAERFGSSEIRLTVGQNAIICNVPSQDVSSLLAQPLLQELRIDPSPIWRNLVACTGSDYCHYSLIDTKTRAVELATELERRGVDVPDDTRLHISGCVHACGKHHIADIGLQGAAVRVGDHTEEAADVYTGGQIGRDGRLATKTIDKVLMSDMASVVAQVLEAGSRAPANP